MKMSIPISLFLYRAIVFHAELIESLDDFPLEDFELEQPLNIATYYLFLMYWMSIADEERVNAMGQISVSKDPYTLLIDHGFEQLPFNEQLVPRVVMGEMFTDWYQEKSARVIEALAKFAEIAERELQEEFSYSETFEYFGMVLTSVGLVYNVASEKPLFVEVTVADRLFEENGLVSFYQSEHRKQSRVILRFLKLWERVEEKEIQRKLLAVRSTDSRIDAVKRIITAHSPSIALIKEAAAPYIAQLHLGPLLE